jgi:hypothetical protein
VVQSIRAEEDDDAGESIAFAKLKQFRVPLFMAAERLGATFRTEMMGMLEIVGMSVAILRATQPYFR